MLWTGCDLIQADPTNPKTIPANSTIALKVELLGWPKMGNVAAYTCKSPAPIDVLKNIDHTPDNLHRMYGSAKIQVQAWTLSETGGLLKPIQAKVWTFEPCEFDDPDMDSDPEEPEDDVGSERWTIGASALQADQRLRAELQRRNEVRRDLARDDGYDDDGEEDDDRAPRGRGGRQPARGGNRRDWGRERPGVDRGRPMPRSGGDVPEAFYDPDAVLPLPAPGMEWGWDDRAGHHRQFPKGSVPAVTPAVAVPVVEKTPFFETSVGAALLGTIVTVGGAVVQKMMEPKPAQADPMTAFATLMAAIGGSKGDPEKLKQLEIEAEDRRARLALEAEDRRTAAAAVAENARIERENNRIEAARIAADAQRTHDAKMEAERREAARLEAIAAEDRARVRAKEDQDRLVMMSRLGLTGEKGPSAEVAVLKAHLEWMQKQPKGADAIKEARDVLKTAGIVVGDGEGMKGIMAALDTEAASKAMEGIAPALGAIVARLFGATLPGVPPPAPAIQIPDVLASRNAINQEVENARMYGRQEGYQQAAAQLAPQQPPPEQAPEAAPPAQEPAPTEAPPAMPQWEAAEAPAATEADPATAQEPPAEAPADPEPTPAPAAEPEAPQAPVAAESAPESPAEPAASVIDRAPDGSTDVVPVTEAA